MKKLLIIVAVAGLSMVSCKKDYTCTCTVTVGGVASASTSTTINDTKNDAEDACNALTSSTTVGGITSSSSCSIQ